MWCRGVCLSSTEYSFGLGYIYTIYIYTNSYHVAARGGGRVGPEQIQDLTQFRVATQCGGTMVGVLVVCTVIILRPIGR